MRTYNTNLVAKAVAQYGEVLGFYPKEWLKNVNNVALTNTREDIALFESQFYRPKTVCGHYFFFSRGKDAVKAAKEFLEEIFSDDYEIETIIGLTPVEHKGALWLNKKLGFKEHGTVDTEIGPCRFVLLNKQEWKDAKQ